MVGGEAVTQKFADGIGTGGYGLTVPGALKLGKRSRLAYSGRTGDRFESKQSTVARIRPSISRLD